MRPRTDGAADLVSFSVRTCRLFLCVTCPCSFFGLNATLIFSLIIIIIIKLEVYPQWSNQDNVCVVYCSGYAAGAEHNIGGSGSNFLCLPKDPDWDAFIDGSQLSGLIAGVEYELGPSNNVFSDSNTGGVPLGNKPAPCAVCLADLRSTILMVPAKTQCPDGWSVEYHGYLASEARSSTRARSSYVCWDRAPEISAGGSSQNQAVIYPVAVICGSLPCSPYITGRELTCVVCSK